MDNYGDVTGDLIAYMQLKDRAVELASKGERGITAKALAKKLGVSVTQAIEIAEDACLSVGVALSSGHGIIELNEDEYIIEFV